MADSGESPLLSLPDEILVATLCQLDLLDLLTVSRVCRQLYTLSQEPIVWIRLFDSSSCMRIKPELRHRVVATRARPGTWDGRDWIVGNGKRPVRHDGGHGSWSLGSIPNRIKSYVEGLFWPHEEEQDEPVVVLDRNDPPLKEDQIAVHFPTLYRSAMYIAEEMRMEGPHRANDPEYPDRMVGTGQEDEFRARFLDDHDGFMTDDDFVEDERAAVHPRYLYMSEEHSAKVYVTRVHGQWLVSGSRDKSFKIWRLPSLPLDGCPIMYTPYVVHTQEMAHDGSILSLAFEDYGDGKGIIVTGSSDHTVKVWEVEWGQGDDYAWNGTRVNLVTTLTKHRKTVPGVALTDDYLISCSHDGHVLVYGRKSLFDGPQIVYDVVVRPFDPDGSFPGDASYPTGLTVWAHLVLITGFPCRWLPTIDLRAGGKLEYLETSSSPDMWANKLSAIDRVGDDCSAYSDDQGHYILDGHTAGVATLRYSGRPARAVRMDDAREVAFFGTHEGTIIGIHYEDDVQRSYRLGGPVFSLDRAGMYMVASTDKKVAVVVYGTGQPYASLLE